MSKQCEVCGKKPIKAAKLTFSHKQIVKRQTPNLQDIRVNVNGQTKKMTVFNLNFHAPEPQHLQQTACILHLLY